ncbi:hypothetical protein ACFE04_018346 [Oxalis oulophora]
MRNSCNGCRVLRKGCSDDCVIKPCLQWIKSAESQANATLFLAKFYGRAGLINLLEASSTELRPVVFKSLLFEACGRNINPINGVLGLLLSDNWDKCQAAVDAVLIKGSPTITFSPSDASESQLTIPPLKSFDIRHIPKEPNQNSESPKTRVHRFKRQFKSGSMLSGHGIDHKMEEGSSSGHDQVMEDYSMMNQIEPNRAGQDDSVQPDLELSL